jgi:hypothetical protein
MHYLYTSLYITWSKCCCGTGSTAISCNKSENHLIFGKRVYQLPGLPENIAMASQETTLDSKNLGGLILIS